MINLTPDQAHEVRQLVDRLQSPSPQPEVPHSIRTASTALAKATRWLDASTSYSLAGDAGKAQQALAVARGESQRAALALDLAVADREHEAGVEVKFADLADVRQRAAIVDGLVAAVDAWGCEAVEHFEGYGACVQGASGSSDAPSETETAMAACTGFIPFRVRCPQGDGDVQAVTSAVAKVEAADAAWFELIEPEVTRVEGEIEASARRWASFQAERDRSEARWGPGVVTGSRSAMAGFVRDGMATERKEEAQREVDERLCDRIRGMTWPKDTKERVAGKLDAVSKAGCFIRKVPAGQ